MVNFYSFRAILSQQAERGCRAGVMGGSSELLDFSERGNGTTQFFNVETMEPVKFEECQYKNHQIQTYCAGPDGF